MRPIPSRGRVFLDRDGNGKVSTRPPYRDIVQDALYGRSVDALNILCEDDAAEGILRGVLDFLTPKHGLSHESIRIGRDTGASEFPMHAEAFRKFGQIQNFVFVLDGDMRDGDMPAKIRETAGSGDFPVLFIPGTEAPEVWVWRRLREIVAICAGALGTDPNMLRARMGRIDSTFAAESDISSQIAKTKLEDLGEWLNRDAPSICRIVARLESEDAASDIQPLIEDLESELLKWRSR